jgi:D-alanine--D-alanine ligase
VVGPHLRLGLVYTLRHPELESPGAAPDAWDEADTADTHDAIARTLQGLGHEVAVRIDTAGAPLGAYEALRGCDLVLSLAVGARGRDREAQVPAILEALGLPYLGSPPLAMALCLDKPTCKRVLRDAGVPTPAFAVDGPPRGARYPLFVKPAREGSSKGVHPGSRVRDRDELLAAIAHVHRTYRQPALVEAYVPGRELCTALLGESLLPTLEVTMPPRGFTVAADKEDLWACLPVSCPAVLPDDVQRRLATLTRRACRVLGVRHMARLDFRWDGSGEPQLIDVNPLPTLRPGGSFYEVAARAAGLDYAALWAALLAAALPGPAAGRRPSP